MATKNEHTGDSIQTRNISEQYRNNYDAIFRKKEKEQEKQDDKAKEVQLLQD